MHYNDVRPDSSLNYPPPVGYAKQAAKYVKSHRKSSASLEKRSGRTAPLFLFLSSHPKIDQVQHHETYFITLLNKAAVVF